ncbi:receptor-interacting serine/threonine-protein kinase 4-like [Chenopodium quinoa]|uniref:receptor-interacting serine/threonine-protein kinase 4-like n=1 Tax=Chenopodium quinoa TaxID=63459 RepID=UPI000B770209|nr:receptor-interacting serine/threonine-protein kinase 4-like [Chenopodium quinoa]
MDGKLYAAARHGDLVSFVEEARINEIESGRSEEYFLQTNAFKENILHLAIQSGQNEFIEKVLKGEELLPRAVTDQLIKQQDFRGDTPLHYEAWMGNIKFFKLLFEYQQEATVLTPVGMALSLQNIDGNTPLHLALIKGKDEVATLLAKHSSDLTRGRKNKDGNTPLHVAA